MLAYYYQFVCLILAWVIHLLIRFSVFSQVQLAFVSSVLLGAYRSNTGVRSQLLNEVNFIPNHLFKIFDQEVEF